MYELAMADVAGCLLFLEPDDEKVGKKRHGLEADAIDATFNDGVDFDCPSLIVAESHTFI